MGCLLAPDMFSLSASLATTQMIAKGEPLTRSASQSSVCLIDLWGNLYCHRDCGGPKEPLEVQLKMQNVVEVFRGCAVSERAASLRKLRFGPQGDSAPSKKRQTP